jgi:hypothetical protein
MIENTKAAPAQNRQASWRHNNAPNQNGIDTLLSHLDKVRASGQGRWMARCPAHGDKGPSLSVRELADGRVLVHCFAGCAVHEVLGAVGMDIEALFPPREVQNAQAERRPFPAADVLRALGFESLVVLMAARSVKDGKALNDADHERLVLAVSRIQDGLNMAGVSHRV